MLTWLELTWFAILLFYFIFDFILYIWVLKIPVSSKQRNVNQHHISVIIAAKNEASNLKDNLPYILNQDYPNFEVVVVNDQSEDNSLKVLKTIAKSYKRLKIVNVKLGLKSSKKNALNEAIKVAQNNYLVFTDADCKPLTQHWLAEIQASFKTENSVIIGFSPYRKTKGFLNKLIQFETLQTAINYFGFSKLGMTYMGVGRNLAYTKSLFKKLNGFQSHQHILSGDDDLFVNQATVLANFELCLNPKTFVESKPKTTFQSWMDQKRRHITTSSHYKTKIKLSLGFQYFIKLAFWILVFPLTIFLEFQNDLQGLFVGIFVLGLMLKMLMNRNVFQKFQTKGLWISQYFLEICLVLFQLYWFMFNLLTPKKTWT